MHTQFVHSVFMNFITNVDLTRVMERQKWKFLYNYVRIPMITILYVLSMQFQPVIMITALSWQYGCNDNKFNG